MERMFSESDTDEESLMLTRRRAYLWSGCSSCMESWRVNFTHVKEHLRDVKRIRSVVPSATSLTNFAEFPCCDGRESNCYGGGIPFKSFFSIQTPYAATDSTYAKPNRLRRGMILSDNKGVGEASESRPYSDWIGSMTTLSRICLIGVLGIFR